MVSARVLLMPPSSVSKYGAKAMEEEISSTLTIENIDFSRESVRKILQGYAPTDSSENRIYGMKKGLEFISNPENLISEENIHSLYQMAIGDFLEDEDNKLLPDNLYRHDRVYVNEYMMNFVRFINDSGKMNDLYKAVMIHFYFAYLHPYFDGNGRMARLLHL